MANLTLDALAEILSSTGLVPNQIKSVLSIYKTGLSLTKNKKALNPRQKQYKALLRQFNREVRKIGYLNETGMFLTESMNVPYASVPDFESYLVKKSDLRNTKSGQFFIKDLRNAIKNMKQITNRLTPTGFASSTQERATNSVFEYLENNGWTIRFESNEQKAEDTTHIESKMLGVYAGYLSRKEVLFMAKKHPEWFQ